ncbi:MAG: hypothetical protein FWC55_09645 [Firmicutes bacterium]|nr:hypothetical protein [Bacillota bacterium]
MNISSTAMQGAIKYKLREPMTTEELYTLMKEKWQAELPGGFQFKRGFLFGPYIRFDTYLTIQPRVKVKNDVVRITRNVVEVQSGGIDLKAAGQAIDKMRHGGNMMDVVMGGPEYFLKVCAEVRNVLEGKVIE